MYRLYIQRNYSWGLLLFFVVYTFTSSCVSSKKMVYFNDLADTMSVPVAVQSTPFKEPKIETNDILAITVQTLVQNPGNTPITSTSTGSFNLLNGFMVDKNGYIELALIGFIKV